MTPGTLNTPIYRGAKWEHTLRLKDRVTGNPLDITGLGPFVLQFENVKTGVMLASAELTSAYDATGQIVAKLPAAVTATFPLGAGAVRVGMRDALNNPYIQDTVDVFHFTPDPATP